MRITRHASLRRLLCAVLLCASSNLSQGKIEDELLAFSVLKNAPLSLPRLAPEAFKLGHRSVRTDSFEVMDLTPVINTRKLSKDGASYLGIEPDAKWNQSLRNKHTDVSYISFTLNASAGTQVDICGASFAIEASRQSPAYAAIRVAESETTLGHEVPWSLFGSSRMAPLNIVTVKIDQSSGTWTMWFRDSLVVADNPLPRKQKGAGRFQVIAGKGGAWVCGFVCSDENPLFEDSNHNAVPDDFETATVGGLVEKGASVESQQTLRRAWLMKRRTMPPTIFVLTTPLPDSFPDLCSPDGEPVHGMTGGLKYGTLRKNQ